MKPTVLIVDDEKNIRDGLRAALEDRYETFVAKDAAEAARLMQDVPPDAVLTDLRMAGEDGMAVIDRALKLVKEGKFTAEDYGPFSMMKHKGSEMSRLGTFEGKVPAAIASRVKAREAEILSGKFVVKVDDSQPKSTAR